MEFKSVLLWLARVLWILVAALSENIISELVNVDSSIGSIIAEIIVWSLWFVTFLALLVPATISLTVIRTLGVLFISVIGLELITAEFSMFTRASLVAIIGCLLVYFFSALLGDVMINGSAYGSEKRFILKPPTFMLFTYLAIIWGLFIVLSITTIQLLIQNNLIGYLTLITVSALGFFGGKILHQFSRRWLVFVPAGFVIHDPLFLNNSVLFKRNNIEHLTTSGIRTIDDETIDLTGGSSGLSSSLKTKEEITIDLKSEKTQAETRNIRFAASLPGLVLKEARSRGIKTQI